MKYKILIIFFFSISCIQNTSNVNTKSPYTSKGFAYIYKDEDFNSKLIKKKFNNSTMQIAHNRLRVGSLIKLINPKTNDFIVLKNFKRLEYPTFYKILITEPVAEKLNLNASLPFIEVIELKKNKSFKAEKTKIFNEEKKIYSKAPIEKVKIDNISTNNIKKKITNDKIYIVIAEFYSLGSANNLLKRISKELKNFESKNLFIKTKKTNKITLLSGPYNSINLMKNDYIQLKKFGFEELDISINE